MISFGSRLLLGATALAAVAAVAYGVSVGGSLGTTGLVSATIALALLTGINIYARDADVSSMDPAAATDSAAARPAPRSSMWPAVGALGGVLVVIGLVTYPVVFVFGLIAMLGATVEWMIAAWSERASADSTYNAGIRQRLSHPAEFPVLAALGAAIIIYSFSRIMLFLSKTGGPVAFGVLATLVLAAGFVVAFKPQVRNATVSAVAGIAVLGLVAGGVAAALAGERELHPYETTSDLAAMGECHTAEETEVDDKASQNIGAKANIHGEIILRQDGTLVARTIGIAGESDSITLTRANATNIRFRNESDADRRLVLNLGERGAIDETTGESIPDEMVPVHLCTQLVENGGSQLLTFSIPRSSSVAESAYSFTVPGVEDQAVEVMVP